MNKIFWRPAVHQEKFKGKTPMFKGHIFDTRHALQADMYVRTPKEIAQYAGRTQKMSDDIKRTIERLQEPLFPQPMLDIIKEEN
eukprot:8641008-Ditylum_brightwellii.AAC.1